MEIRSTGNRKEDTKVGNVTAIKGGKVMATMTKVKINCSIGQSQLSHCEQQRGAEGESRGRLASRSSAT